MLETVEKGHLIDKDGATRCVLVRPRVGTEPWASKMALNCSLKFSIASERSLWKTLRTSTPASAWEYRPRPVATRIRSAAAHASWRAES